MEKSMGWRNRPNFSVENKQSYRLLFCLLLTFLLGIRLFFLIKQYAVNILFVDQWDVYAPVFSHWNIWQTFSQQYGPHRQGMGGILIKVIANYSHLNSLTDAYASLILVFLASLAALGLKWRLFRKWSYFDAVIPIIFLTVSQFETFIITPNVAHSAFPLLLVILSALAWTIKNRYWRYPLVLTLNFMTMYTGFGVFIGIVTPALLAVELFHTIRRKENHFIPALGSSFALSLLTIFSYFHNYAFAPAVSCFAIKASYVPKYPAFMGVILARFLSVSFSETMWLSVGIGAVLLAATGITLFVQGFQVIKNNSSPVGLFAGSLLGGYTLIFLMNAAIGRQCLGMAAAYTSRYVTLAIPGLFAIYLFIQTLKKPLWRNTALILFLLLIVISLPLRQEDLIFSHISIMGR